MTLPTGTVTFLFTDIEGSTKLWETQPDAMQVALERHDDLLRSAIERHNGHVFKTVGDAFCAAFHTAPDGMNAAIEAHLALQGHEWDEKIGPLRVRMGLHAGECQERDCDYFGATLNRTARLQGVAYGQQTLLTQAVYERVVNQLPAGVRLKDLGTHRLKDLAAPEHVWQVIHQSLPAEFGPLKTLDYLPTNLPRQITSFIGREKEMAEVECLLQKTSLLTLTGSGGTGKTRLAVQAAAEVLEEYADGVWLVELAALSDAGHVPQTVAGALGVREAAGEPITHSLTLALRDKHLLLVLDNCEHVLEATARLTEAILRACPRVKVLASSREGLGITGETAYRVPSLSLPDPKQPQTPDSLSHYESVRLFIDRAAQMQTTFAVTNQNAPVLASVCSRLDGIPLAIELAAARVRSLSVEEINARLDQRFRLLTGGSRTALPRQQTLRSLIDWSYDLLNDTERALLLRLSVFAGGWTLEAAEAVCTGDGVEVWEVLDLLSALSDKSLVAAEQLEGSTRYRLLETVRQYARDRLMESGAGNQWRERHLACFLTLAEEGDSKLSGREQSKWLERLEIDHENLRGALEWSFESLSPGAPRTALRFCGVLSKFWSIRGHLSEGREWCERALKAGDVQDHTQERATALIGAGVLAKEQDDYPVARAYSEEGQAICREIGDNRGVANALQNLANVADKMRDFTTARAYHEASLEISRDLGEETGIANSLMGLGTVADQQGDSAAARAFFHECLAIKQKLGEWSGVAKSLLGLGIAAHRQHDSATARIHIEEGLALSRQIGDRVDIALSLHWLGMIAYDQDDEASGRVYFQESVDVASETGQRRRAVDGLQWLGHLAWTAGDYDSSRTHFQESLHILREIGDCGRTADILRSLALLTTTENRPTLTATLLGAADTLWAESGTVVPTDEVERFAPVVAEVKQALGEQAFVGAWEIGRAMTMEQAIEFALLEPAS